jgi:pimeloyl-ACP methyl ester carboxylesterase
MIYDKQGCIDHEVCGDGPTVVLVPGSCSTAAAWRPIMQQWQGRFRCVTMSLLGYGGTAERRTALDTGMTHEAEVLEAVIQHAGGPVHLVGHSFGGLVAVAVALRNRVPLLSLTVIEAPAVDLLRQAGEHAHYRAFLDVSDGYFAACDAGDTTAIARMIDFFGGAGTFAALPKSVREHAIETTSTNRLDWATAYGFRPLAASLGRIAVPTLALCGEASHPAVVRANELLGYSMAPACVATIRGAGHFMIATHPKDVAAIIARQVARFERTTSMNSIHVEDDKRSFVAAPARA